MEKIKHNRLLLIAYGCMALSVVSLFITIVEYTNGRGVRQTFSVVDFLTSDLFEQFVLTDYFGTVTWDINIAIVRVFVLSGIGSLVCAMVGLMILSQQKRNLGSFILTLVGLVGTMAPAVLIMIAVSVYNKDFAGRLMFGMYPVITPIAMLVSILAATEMYRRNKEMQEKMKAAEGLISYGGDMDE